MSMQINCITNEHDIIYVYKKPPDLFLSIGRVFLCGYMGQKPLVNCGVIKVMTPCGVLLNLAFCVNNKSIKTNEEKLLIYLNPIIGGRAKKE